MKNRKSVMIVASLSMPDSALQTEHNEKEGEACHGYQASLCLQAITRGRSTMAAQ